MALLKVHVEYDKLRGINSWVVADSEELMDTYCDKLIEAHYAVEDWLPRCGAKIIFLADIVPPNLFRPISLINPLNLVKNDLKSIPPILCVNDEVFNICGKKATVSGIKILKSLANLNFLQKCAMETHFHLVGLHYAI